MELKVAKCAIPTFSSYHCLVNPHSNEQWRCSAIPDKTGGTQNPSLTELSKQIANICWTWSSKFLRDLREFLGVASQFRSVKGTNNWKLNHCVFQRFANAWKLQRKTFLLLEYLIKYSDTSLGDWTLRAKGDMLSKFREPTKMDMPFPHFFWQAWSRKRFSQTKQHW